MLASKLPSSASAYMNPALAAQFDYNSNLTEFHYILEDYVYLQEKLDILEFASLQLEKQERLTEQVKEKLDNTYDRLSQITNKKKKEAAKLEQLKHLSIRSFFSKIKGTRSSELVKAEKVYQNICKQYEQAKKAFDVNKSLWDESKKELLECQTNNKNYNRYKNELEELLQEVFDGPTPNFPQEDALEQQVMKLFLNFTQLSQVIHQCELAKTNLKNCHMYLVNFFKGTQTVRDYASMWDLSATSTIKTLKENEKHDDLTILSDAKDFIKQANEQIQHARVLLTKKTNLTSNKIERLEELFESMVDTQEYKSKDTIKKIDSNLEKELGETRIWLGEEIQSLKHEYTKEEKELAIFKNKLFEERQRILNLWVINLDETVKKRMIENSLARGRKRSKSKILKSISQEDENDSNWFDTSGITCAADLAVRNNTISRNASVKSSATLFNKDIDSIKVGSCPASNGFYTLNNINQYMGSTPSLVQPDQYYQDPMFNSLPRWPMNQMNQYGMADMATLGRDFSFKTYSDQSPSKFNSDTYSQEDHEDQSQSHSQSPVSSSSPNPLNKKSSESQSLNLENSKFNNNNKKNNSSSSDRRNSTHTSRRSLSTRSGTKNSFSSNHFGHATTSAININGTRAPSLDYTMGNIYNNASAPNSLGMIGVMPRIHPNSNNYMYNRYSLDQYLLQAAYLPQYYSYNASVSDISPTSLFNPYVVSNSYATSPYSTSMTNGINSLNTNINGRINHSSSVKLSSSPSNPINTNTIQRSRSAIVSHVMDKPLNRGVVNETINLHLPVNSSKSSPTNNVTKMNTTGGGSIPNISQLQQSPMFPFPQRSRSASARSSIPREDRLSSSPFSFHKKRSNTIPSRPFNSPLNSPNYDTTKKLENKSALSKIPTISLEDINGNSAIILNKTDEEEEEEKEGINVIKETSEEEEEEEDNDDDSSSNSSTSVSSSSDDEDNDDEDNDDEDNDDEDNDDDDNDDDDNDDDDNDDDDDDEDDENGDEEDDEDDDEDDDNEIDDDDNNEEEDDGEESESGDNDSMIQNNGEIKEEEEEEEENENIPIESIQVKPIITERKDSKNVNLNKI